MGTRLASGTKIGRYLIYSQLGAGGMGEVYLALDTELDRKVAVKILPEDVAEDQKRLQRFSLEAKAASALNHPNILTIHEFGQSDGRHFMVTEFVDGTTLRERLVSGDPIRLPEALEIAIQVSSALAAAHAAGIVHRDIKPDNLMLRQDGFVKVLDFGLAKVTTPPASPVDSKAETVRVNTEPGTIIGTVTYMSPEQTRGRLLDARTDIWSLGIVLYEMMVGQTPFAGRDVHRQIIAIQEQEAPPLGRFVAGVPERLEEIVVKTLAKSADERYQTAKDLLIDLKRLKQKLEIGAEIERSTPHEVSQSGRTAAQREAVTTAPAAAAGTAVGGGSSHPISGFPAHRRGALIVLATLVALALVGLYFIYARRAAPGSAPTISSIAVLPFVNTGNNPDTEYLSEGISESLINGLSQLPGVKVIARSSSFKYNSKDADTQAVAKALGVEAILTGRVLQRGDDLIISVELVNARDKTQLWGEQYNRKAADVLQVQSEISRVIAEKLRVRLTGGSQQFAKPQTTSPQAYGLLLQGRFYSSKSGSENRKKALEYFKQAIAIDPTYATAYAELSASYTYLMGNGVLEPSEFAPRAEAAVHRALELDNGLAEAHLALANIKLNAWEWVAAEREYQSAIELNPNLAEAYRWYSVYLSDVGRHDEAIAGNARARELDPLSLAVKADAAFALLMARRYEQGVESLKKTLEMEPKLVLAHLYLGYIYSAMGKHAEAIAEFQEARGLGDDSSSSKIYMGAVYARAGERAKADQILKELQTAKAYVSPGELAILYTALDQREQAFASLEKAYAAHDLQLQYLGVDASFDNLRADPRFQDLLRRVGLPLSGK